MRQQSAVSCRMGKWAPCGLRGCQLPSEAPSLLSTFLPSTPKALSQYISPPQSSPRLPFRVSEQTEHKSTSYKGDDFRNPHPLLLHRKETHNCLGYGCVSVSWLFRKALRGGRISFWLGACMHMHSVHTFVHTHAHSTPLCTQMPSCQWTLVPRGRNSCLTLRRVQNRLAKQAVANFYKEFSVAP